MRLRRTSRARHIGAGRGQIGLLGTGGVMVVMAGAVAWRSLTQEESAPAYALPITIVLAAVPLLAWWGGLTGWASTDQDGVRWRFRGPRWWFGWDRIALVEFGEERQGFYVPGTVRDADVPRLVIRLHGPRLGRVVLRTQQVIAPAVAVGREEVDGNFALALLDDARRAGRPVLITSAEWTPVLGARVSADETRRGWRPPLDLGFLMQLLGMAAAAAGILLAVLMVTNAAGSGTGMVASALVVTAIPTGLLVAGGILLLGWGRSRVRRTGTTATHAPGW